MPSTLTIRNLIGTVISQECLTTPNPPVRLAVGSAKVMPTFIASLGATSEAIILPVDSSNTRRHRGQATISPGKCGSSHPFIYVMARDSPAGVACIQPFIEYPFLPLQLFANRVFGSIRSSRSLMSSSMLSSQAADKVPTADHPNVTPRTGDFADPGSQYRSFSPGDTSTAGPSDWYRRQSSDNVAEDGWSSADRAVDHEDDSGWGQTDFSLQGYRQDPSEDEFGSIPVKVCRCVRPSWMNTDRQDTAQRNDAVPPGLSKRFSTIRASSNGHRKASDL